jgi:peptide/nickel transport system substrate-binding protein
MKRLLWVLGVLALAVVVMHPSMAATRGGKLIYARYADSLFLDPVLNDANVDIWILTNLYDTLFEPTADGKDVEPGLATEWSVSDDGLTYTVKLRQGTKFSDGAPITAEDVKWSLDRARNPKNGIWNFTLASVDTIEVSAPDSITLHLKQPDPVLIKSLATFNTAILPQKPFEASPGSTDEEKAKAFAEHPVGSGPFQFDSWERNVSMKLKRNPNYWRMGEDGKPLPYLDEIEFVIIPDDATRILKLQAGEVDGAEFIPYARVAELKNDANLNMELFPSTKVTFLTVNVRPTFKDGSKNPMSDPRVRQAMNYAVDKDALIKIVTFDVGKPQRSFMSSATPYVSGDGPAFPFDAAKAKALLADAGYGDGIDVSCLALAGSADDTAILSTLQQMWSQVGIRLKLEQVDNATRTARYRAGDFQMRVSLWTDDIADPSEIVSYFAYFPNIESLHTGWEDKKVNALFEASQKEMDATKRTDQYKQIQDIYMQAPPLVLLYEVPYPVALRKSVKGFNQIPLGNNIFAGAYVEQ